MIKQSTETLFRFQL